jgi:hypothetical protein
MTDAAEATRPDTGGAVVYPSAAVPGVPAFMFTAPAGWIIDEAPGAFAVLRAPQADGPPLDAILRHERVPATVTLEDVATATWARIQRDIPDARQSFDRVAAFGPSVVYLRGISYAVDGATTGELQALLLAPKVEGRKTADLFQFTITGPADALRPHGEQFVAMVASFRFI